jgi:isoquinoline 1-oxidoreductase beta subunit
MSLTNTSGAFTRRKFLKTGAAGGAALVIGFYLPSLANDQQQQEEPRPNPFNAWVRIDQNGHVTLTLARSEMGQGVTASLPMILAEEVDVDWAAVRVEQAATRPDLYGDQGTGGSDSVHGSWTPLRQAGAAARQMLVAAAAESWHVNIDTCTTKNGSVWHGPRHRELKYGELVERASKMPVPDFKKVTLKNPDNFTIVGKSLPRADIPPKVDGTAIFGIDVRVPGMLYAVVVRCPTFGGKAAKFDAAKAKAIPGVRHVVEIEAVGPGAHTAGGIAVVADTTAIAIQGREALEIQWDRGPNANESSDSLRQQFQSLVEKPGKVIANAGDFDAVFAGSASKIDATYELPFLAHATMEPMNCTVDIRPDRAEVWAPTQGPDWIHDVVTQIAGVPPDKVVVHTILMGGAFGRRYQADYAVEAAQVSKAVGKPIQLVWTREDDMQHDFYRPATCQRVQAALDAQGRIAAWRHLITSTSIRAFWDPPDRANPEGQELGESAQLPYATPNFRLEYSPAASGVPRAWWRSVEDSMNGFVLESFVDELAVSAKVDPLTFRLSHMDPPRRVADYHSPHATPLDTQRLKAVAQLAAEKSGWGKPMPAGRGRGIACYFSFDSYVAEVAEVTVAKDGKLKVDRVVCAVDCGRAVNPDGVAAQMEGAIVYALSAALMGEITIAGGAVKQGNWDDYPVLRMREMPIVEVHIVPSSEPPSGCGEPAVPPLAPAVANAIFAATGKRIRRLPIRPADLRTT